MSERYEVYAKSFASDPWGIIPVYRSDDLEQAQSIANDWFEQEGWYAIVVDTRPVPQIVYVDYWEPENDFEFSPEALKR